MNYPEKENSRYSISVLAYDEQEHCYFVGYWDYLKKEWVVEITGEPYEGRVDRWGENLAAYTDINVLN